MFSHEFCEIFKKTYFLRTPPVDVSAFLRIVQTAGCFPQISENFTNNFPFGTPLEDSFHNQIVMIACGNKPISQVFL